MVQLENRHWGEVVHSPFTMLYAGLLVVRSFSGEELTGDQQRVAAVSLTDTVSTGIQRVTVDTDPFLPTRTILTLRLEAESDLDALHCLCVSAIESWTLTGHEPTDLEFVEAHLAYEPQLQKDQGDDPSADISDAHYLVEEIELPELDVFDNALTTEASDIFYRVRDEA